jgi:hypothetical protein
VSPHKRNGLNAEKVKRQMEPQTEFSRLPPGAHCLHPHQPAAGRFAVPDASMAIHQPRRQCGDRIWRHRRPVEVIGAAPGFTPRSEKATPAWTTRARDGSAGLPPILQVIADGCVSVLLSQIVFSVGINRTSVSIIESISPCPLQKPWSRMCSGQREVGSDRGLPRYHHVHSCSSSVPRHTKYGNANTWPRADFLPGI